MTEWISIKNKLAIRRFIKRLFCGHNWQELKRLGTRSEVQCSKCGLKDIRALADFY